MLHPFAWLATSYRWALLAILLAATVFLAVTLTVQGSSLKTSVAANGILSYEFAWNQARAQAILDSWSSIEPTARRQLLLDFGFLIAYPMLLSLACAMLAGSSFNSMAGVGVFISWAVLAAGPLDAVENFALLRMLDQGAIQSLARLSGWCAGIKFLLVFSALGYIVLQGLVILVGRLRTA